jgi:hypothetical protein
MMMSLDNVLNCAQKLVFVPGNPRDKPTVPYADTISKRTLKMLKPGSLGFWMRAPSMQQIKKSPRNTYHKSKDS